MRSFRTVLLMSAAAAAGEVEQGAEAAAGAGGDPKAADNAKAGDPTPTLGRIVLFTLGKDDAIAINKQRNDATLNMHDHVSRASGVQLHTGNDVKEGCVYPMVITTVWGDTPNAAVNGQVLLDGNDTYWATSVCRGTGPHTFAWPSRG